MKIKSFIVSLQSLTNAVANIVARCLLIVLKTKYCNDTLHVNLLTKIS